MSIAKFAAATAVAALMATGASAATYDYIPGAGAASANNALISTELSGILDADNDQKRGGWFGATLYLIAGAAGATITVDYLGAEAGNNNSFTWGSGLATQQTGGGTSPNGVWGDPLASLGSFLTSAGQLVFSFTSSSHGTVNNGDANDASAPNFFISFENEAASGGQIAYLFFDDHGAVGDNHDDMLIRLSITGGSIGIAPIPIPAAGFLLLGGLGALGVIARRRKPA